MSTSKTSKLSNRWEKYNTQNPDSTRVYLLKRDYDHQNPTELLPGSTKLSI